LVRFVGAVVIAIDRDKFKFIAFELPKLDCEYIATSTRRHGQKNLKIIRYSSKGLFFI
jgi:hypothetical protein